MLLSILKAMAGALFLLSTNPMERLKPTLYSYLFSFSLVSTEDVTHRNQALLCEKSW